MLPLIVLPLKTPTKKVSQYTSNLYCNTPPICIAVILVPLRFEQREILSVLLPFVSQYAPHLYCNTPPICIAVLLGKSWWWWSPGCSPVLARRARDCSSLRGENPGALFFLNAGPISLSSGPLVGQEKIRARQKGDSKREKPDPERTFSQIFADFR